MLSIAVALLAGDGGATVALAIEAAATCAPAGPCGDVNGSNTVTSSDALAVLKKAVGGSPAMSCQCTGEGASVAASPLVTGQSGCWNTAGDSIPCAGSGQDADLHKGVARSFTDNGNGTITDNSTGLMWEKLSDDDSVHDRDTTYSWAAAFSTKIATLNSSVFAGHSDWRLPNLRELQSLADYGRLNPALDPVFNSGCTPGCTVTTCSCSQSFHFWTSTTAPDAPSYAWYVYFVPGGISAESKTALGRVRAVRTAP